MIFGAAVETASVNTSGLLALPLKALLILEKIVAIFISVFVSCFIEV